LVEDILARWRGEGNKFKRWGERASLLKGSCTEIRLVRKEGGRRSDAAVLAQEEPPETVRPVLR
jgi:hypothetical protein